MYIKEFTIIFYFPNPVATLKKLIKKLRNKFDIYSVVNKVLINCEKICNESFIRNLKKEYLKLLHK